MKSIGAPRVAHHAGRYVASAVRHRGQLCTVVNPQGSTYRSGKVVQTNRATSNQRFCVFALVLLSPFDGRVNPTFGAATKTALQAFIAAPRYVSASGEEFLGCSGD
jgi:hypothetical protein